MTSMHYITLVLTIALFNRAPSFGQAATLPAFDREGHRGCRGLMPENTIPAMLRAIDLGVTTLEMDIVFTKDKVAVVSHDPYFNRDITTKPDGSFLSAGEAKKYVLYQMTFEETKRFDVGSKPQPRFPDRSSLPVTKPSLAALVDSVENYLSVKKGAPAFYNIETKTSPLTDNLYHPEPDEFVDRLMSVINEKQIGPRVIIQSFDFRTLRIIHEKYPSIMTSMLIEDYDHRSLEDQLKSLGFTPTIYSPAYGLVSKPLVDACHEKKMRVVPWTVNDRKKMDELRAMGVDGIISDYPNIFNAGDTGK